MFRPTLPLLLCAAAIAVGCGSDDGDSAAPAAPAGENQVGMKDLKFVPEAITVKAGDTITWTNQESIPHNVVNAEEGEQPKSELFNEGGTYEFTPKEPGEIEYVCTIHPGMEGTITVE
jgi:plastocyanin